MSDDDGDYEFQEDEEPHAIVAAGYNVDGQPISYYVITCRRVFYLYGGVAKPLRLNAGAVATLN